MGSSSPKKEDKEQDKSFISTILQVLYNINILQEYIKNNEFNNNKYLSNALKELFDTRISKIDWEQESKKIIKLLLKYYNLKIESKPGEALIQILMVLKLEEKDMLLPNWENEALNNQKLFNNLVNEKMALNDILDINRNNFDTLLASNFFGIMLSKRKLMNNNNIMFFYNFYCVYEMNLPAIYYSMVNKGKIMHDENNLPNLNLIDCIKEMQETKIQIYNNQQCLTEYYMFNAPNYLIFILNNEHKNLEQFRGHVLFQELSDFSSVILNTQINKFKLFSIIDSKRYNQKNKEKDGAQWFQNNEELDDKQYKALIRNENSEIFFYYNEENKTKDYSLNIIDNNYFHHILIFSRLNNN